MKKFMSYYLKNSDRTTLLVKQYEFVYLYSIGMIDPETIGMFDHGIYYGQSKRSPGDRMDPVMYIVYNKDYDFVYKLIKEQGEIIYKVDWINRDDITRYYINKQKELIEKGGPLCY